MRATTLPLPAAKGGGAPPSPTCRQVYGEAPFRTDGQPLALAFPGDGRLISVEEPGVLRLWNEATGQPLAWHLLSGLETVWAFRADGRVLASANDQLSLWDVQRGRRILLLPQASWVTALAFHAEGRLLASGHDDGSLRLWDTATGTAVRTWRAHRLPVSAVAFGPGGELASAGEEKVIHLWDAAGAHRGTLVGHKDRIPALAWHPDGARLISAGWDTTARVWDTARLEPLLLLNGHAGQVTALALSADGSLVASADSDNVVHVWDVLANRPVGRLAGHEGEVRALAFDPTARRLASAGDDLVLRIHDLESARAGMSLPSPANPSPAEGDASAAFRVHPRPFLHEAAPARAYAAGRQHVAGAERDGSVRLWEATSGQLTATLEGPREAATALAFSADERLLATASRADTSVWVWDIARAEAHLLIQDALDGAVVEGLAFDSAARHLAVTGIDCLATGGTDGSTCVWDLAERRVVAYLPGGATAVAFHPDGNRLAVASLDRSVYVWDCLTEEVLVQLLGHDELVYGIAFSRDGRLVATGGDDRTVRLWDPNTGDCLGLLQLDTQVKGLAFGPDDAFLYTRNGNTSCYQLDVRHILRG